MGMGHSGTETRWDREAVGLRHDGNGTQWD